MFTTKTKTTLLLVFFYQQKHLENVEMGVPNRGLIIPDLMRMEREN